MLLVDKKDIFEIAKSFGIDSDTFEKAQRNMAHLHKEVITDKNGHRKTVFKRNEIDEKKVRSKKPDEFEAKKTPGNPAANSEKMTKESINNVKKYSVGQHVEFAYGGNTLKGEIVSQGKDGVTIKTPEDGRVKVKYQNLGATVKNSDGTIPPEKFNANDYKNQFTDPKATDDAAGIQYIYKSLGYEGAEAEAQTIKRMDQLSKRMMKMGGTDVRFTVDKEHKVYTAERQLLHQKIIKEFFKGKLKSCKPKNGEAPKFIMFGGRGGSGKSWFTDTERAKNEGREVMFDPSKFLVIDTDEIKKSLPEFEGWNAGEVHEESSYLSKRIIALAKAKGLNIIIDGTMNYNSKNPDKVRKQILDFKNSGYSCEAHYMFLPVQESTKRAINRFKSKKGDYSGRLVPMNVLLGMQDNEKSFDSVKDIVDKWSFRDNQGTDGPKLISQKETK